MKLYFQYTENEVFHLVSVEIGHIVSAAGGLLFCFIQFYGMHCLHDFNFLFLCFSQKISHFHFPLPVLNTNVFPPI